jgi:hypothetical protein
MIKNYCAEVLIGIFLIGPAFAGSLVADAAVSRIPATQLNLPSCLNLESDIAEIQRVQKGNYKTSHKYDGYRNILHTATALELAARLTYAETVAANCETQQDRIVDLIASVIGNRVRIRRGDVGSVVFQRDQFASSLNIYPESRYRDFLCPSDSSLWNLALATMRANLEESKPSAPIPTDTVNYYLYRHSERFKVPAWKLAEVSTPDEKTRECIRVFRDPAWK